MNGIWCIFVMLCLVCVHIYVQEAWVWTVICREGGAFAFSAIRLKLAFSKMSYCTFNACVLNASVYHFDLYRKSVDYLWTKKGRYQMKVCDYLLLSFRTSHILVKKISLNQSKAQDTPSWRSTNVRLSVSVCGASLFGVFHLSGSRWR